MKTGHDSKVRSPIKNPAYLTLREIEEGKDVGVMLVETPQTEEEKA